MYSINVNPTHQSHHLLNLFCCWMQWLLDLAQNHVFHASSCSEWYHHIRSICVSTSAFFFYITYRFGDIENLYQQIFTHYTRINSQIL